MDVYKNDLQSIQLYGQSGSHASEMSMINRFQSAGHVHHNLDGPDVRGLGLPVVLRPHPRGDLLSSRRRWTSGALDLYVEKYKRSFPGLFGT